MATYLIELFLLWSAIFTNHNFICAASDDPKMTLGNGTILSFSEVVIIEYGHPLELFCSGNASNIKMTRNGEELVTDTVNETTVRFLVENPERQDTHYFCEVLQSISRSLVRVIVDSPPTVTDFQCKSKNQEYLNCTWASENVIRKCSLYYIEEETNEIASTFLLCEVYTFDSMYCVWDSKNPSIPFQADDEFNLLMETCNRLGCANQTFVFNHFAITELDTPDLRLLWKSSRSAAVVWKLRNRELVEHRISYWYSGVHQIRVNTKPLQENDGPLIISELELPCASTFYEVRLSVRPKTADGEGFWSEDGVISFVTEPEPEKEVAAVDPTCTRPRVTIIPEIMLYEIEKFRDRVEKEQNELKERIRLQLRVLS